jgi:hypothetical protein
MIEVHGAKSARGGRRVVLEVAVEGSEVWLRRRGEADWIVLTSAVADRLGTVLTAGAVQAIPRADREGAR